MSVADSSILIEKSDMNILVVRHGINRINEIKQSLSSETYSTEEFNEKVSLLEFEIKELSDEVLEPIEYESLSEEYKRLSNSEFLMNKAKECENMLLKGPGSVY